MAEMFGKRKRNLKKCHRIINKMSEYGDGEREREGKREMLETPHSLIKCLYSTIKMSVKKTIVGSCKG